MSNARRYQELGIPTSYHEHARYYERLFTNLGWNENQITEALKFGATYQGDGSEADVSDKFRWLAAHIDAPDIDTAVDVGLGLRDSITMNGLEALPEISRAESSFSKADEARLAEIKAISRDDPMSFDANKALQDEQLALIEAQLASNGTATPSQSKPAPVATPAPATDRLAQIREMSRNDPDGYNRNPALIAEELSLIEASLPTSAPQAVSGEAAASQPSAGDA